MTKSADTFARVLPAMSLTNAVINEREARAVWRHMPRRLSKCIAIQSGLF
jgi:hypothetical protein